MYGHNPYGFGLPEAQGPEVSPEGRVDFVDLPRLVRKIDTVWSHVPPLFLSEWGVQGGNKRARSELGFVLNFKK